MGADRVSALQFPSHMRASTRLRSGGWLGCGHVGRLAVRMEGRVDSRACQLRFCMRGAQRPPLARSRVVPPAFTDGVELSLAVADPAAPSTSAQPSPASSASGGWAKADAEAPAAAHSSNGSDNRSSGGGGGGEAGQAAHGAAIIPAAPVAAQGGGAAAAEGLDAQLQRLRLAAQESDGILQSLAVKYGCSDGGGANAGGRCVPASTLRPSLPRSCCYSCTCRCRLPASNRTCQPTHALKCHRLHTAWPCLLQARRQRRRRRRWQWSRRG